MVLSEAAISSHMPLTDANIPGVVLLVDSIMQGRLSDFRFGRTPAYPKEVAFKWHNCHCSLV